MARPKKETTTEPLDEIQLIAQKEKELSEMKKNVKFNFQKQAQKIHSLYKLALANFKANKSWTNEANFVDVEHTHFFHTINSSGQAQTTCAPVGGHFHEMIMVTPATEDTPPVYKCSGPMKKVRQKNAYGSWEVVSVPVNAIDHHTHEVTYLHSEIWNPPKMNPEFTKLQAQMAAKIVKSSEFYEQ